MNVSPISPNGLQRGLVCGCVSLWLALVIAGHCAVVHGQQPPQDPLKVQRGAAGPINVPNQQPVGGGVIQQQTRPFYLQGAVTVLIAGGAIWTVCRSSRRM